MENQEKKARLREAASVLLQASPESELKIVVLNKALFYSDLICLRDFGETFTGNTYMALEQGPVIAHYSRRLVKPLQKDGTVIEAVNGNAKPLRLVKMPELNFCKGQWLKSFERIGKKFSELTSQKVSEVSHNNLGWKISWRRGGQNGAHLPIDMNIAMQQLQGDKDDEAWLNEELSEDERKVVEAAGGGTDW